jgi:beta-barrel assembly-enhancing protease
MHRARPKGSLTPSTSELSDAVIEGRLYDGVTAHPHAVRATIEGAVLELSHDSGWSERVDASVLKRIDSTGAELRVGRTDSPGWRLVLPAGAEVRLATLLGHHERYGRWIDRIGLVPALIVGGIITGLVVGIGYVAPAWIAPHVPMSWERNVGGAMVGDFGKLRCRDAKGQQALESLVERVAPGSTRGPNPIKVAALDVRVFNAAALPGGYIVVFKPAITETDSDALAGILAHEVAHVRRRHVTEALIRELGIGALIRLFAGDIGANAEQLVALSYTRANEAQADADAIAMLRRARISPRPIAALFRRLGKESPAFSAEFLQSHPLTGTRAAKFEAAFDAHEQYRPALSSAEADALFDICRKNDKRA